VTIGRVRFMDEQRVNLDGFAVADAELGLVAFDSPYDPEPSLRMSDGRVVELDSKGEAEFDIVDTFIALHGIDLNVATEAMALDNLAVARMFVDPGVPRSEVVRLVAGMTPAKLACVLGTLRPAELVIAMTKMRARRTPSNQAHVTNRSDDPLLLAADAATAAAFGFREIETTVRSNSGWVCAVWCLMPKRFRFTGPSRSSSMVTTPPGPKHCSLRLTHRVASKCA
jgi:propanediol dehydratase large subunit